MLAIDFYFFFISIYIIADYITSQNYPNVYPMDFTATWTLSADGYAGTRTTLVITDMAIECDCSDCDPSKTCAASCDFAKCSACPYDYVKVIFFIAEAACSVGFWCQLVRILEEMQLHRGEFDSQIPSCTAWAVRKILAMPPMSLARR